MPRAFPRQLTDTTCSLRCCACVPPGAAAVYGHWVLPLTSSAAAISIGTAAPEPCAACLPRLRSRPAAPRSGAQCWRSREGRTCCCTRDGCPGWVGGRAGGQRTAGWAGVAVGMQVVAWGRGPRSCRLGPGAAGDRGRVRLSAGRYCSAQGDAACEHTCRETPGRRFSLHRRRDAGLSV